MEKQVRKQEIYFSLNEISHTIDMIAFHIVWKNGLCLYVWGLFLIFWVNSFQESYDIDRSYYVYF